MTVPILILIGEADDWTLAQECRNMVEGRDDWGISRHKGGGAPIKLVVYPNAYHAFDAVEPEDADPVFRSSPRIQPGGDGAIDRCGSRIP